MKQIFKISGTLILSFFIFSSCTQKKINIKTLLDEMHDRTALTYFPEDDYKLKQSSSYNRKTVAVGEAGWYENSDMSHFIRVEENKGRREFVMFDQDGPGVIVRWWMTFWRAENGILRIYLDHQTEPVVEGAPFDVISGQFLAPAPFSQSVPAEAPLNERGHNLYVPIPYAQHCKVTYECDSLREKEHYFWPDVFYNICYQEYGADTRIETFTLESLKEAGEVITETKKQLLKDFSSSQNAESFDQVVLPGDSVILRFTETGQAVDILSLNIDSKDHGQALRSCVVSISFDGLQTVWVPVGDFFGTGFQMHPHKTWLNQTDEDDLMTSAWIMPYKEECRVCYINFGTDTVRITGQSGLTPYTWSENSMYFGACWHEYYHLNTRDTNNWMFDLNYVDIDGKGMYAGDQITLFNMAETWWGEGDEKIFVDGEIFPSSIGTGSEDYYGYAFAHPEPYSHPFISQPSGSGNWVPGMTVNIRHRSLDAIPFTSSISTNIEMWHWASTCINYSLTSYFYAKLPFEINITPNIQSVQRPVPTSKDDFYDHDENCYTIEELK